MDYHCKRSGQIPAFGNWDSAVELPITQYFESARQAGLIRFSSSSGEESTPCVPAHDLYEVDSRKHSRNLAPPPTKVREKGGAEQKKAGRVYDVSLSNCKHITVTEPPARKLYPRQHVSLSNNNSRLRNSKQLQYDAVPTNPKRLPVRAPKPVDEDLYKIPPELLNSSKRKKRPGFFSCLVPACAT